MTKYDPTADIVDRGDFARLLYAISGELAAWIAVIKGDIVGPRWLGRSVG